MSDVLLAKIINSIWLPIGMMILVKASNNLAPGGILDTLYFAVSNLESIFALCTLKNIFIGNLRQFVFDIIPFFLLFVVL